MLFSVLTAPANSATEFSNLQHGAASPLHVQVTAWFTSNVKVNPSQPPHMDIDILN